MISLLTVPIGKRARLASVSRGLRSRLRQYGLHIGDEVRVLRSAPLGGPLLIEVDDREMALGGVLAEKILVELICESR
ncbi:MAG TPA: FeoA family protein [Anaerolineales bacterium]|nr:FeoA family protein [Anaerolineales bacterium]